MKNKKMNNLEKWTYYQTFEVLDDGEVFIDHLNMFNEEEKLYYVPEIKKFLVKYKGIEYEYDEDCFVEITKDVSERERYSYNMADPEEAEFLKKVMSEKIEPYYSAMNNPQVEYVKITLDELKEMLNKQTKIVSLNEDIAYCIKNTELMVNNMLDLIDIKNLPTEKYNMFYDTFDFIFDIKDKLNKNVLWKVTAYTMLIELIKSYMNRDINDDLMLFSDFIMQEVNNYTIYMNKLKLKDSRSFANSFSSVIALGVKKIDRYLM